MSNYLPPAILPTPPNYQDQQLHNAKTVVDFSTTNVIPNSLLGRPHTLQQSADTLNGNPPESSMAALTGAGNAAGLNSSVVGAPPVPNGVSPAKMFVGGLPQSVTQETLNEYFGRYGNIVEAFVLMDDQSGRSRGFGFVTFENAQSLNDVLAARPHYLAGKHVDCKHAVLKSSTTSAASSSARAAGENEKINFTTMHPLSQQQQQQRPSFDDRTMEAAGDNTTNDDDDLFLTGGGKSYLALSGDKWLEDCAEADERKIFVGGLPDVTPAEFAGFFEHFGPVADAMVMFDRKRRRQRGFGFITFATNDGVTNALKYHRHPVKGKLVEVKKAHPLVLQKARAPARRERDQQLQAQQGQSRRGSPSLSAAKRKTSLLEAQAPWAADSAMPAARHQDPWKRLRPEEEEDVFKSIGGGEFSSVGGGGMNSMAAEMPTSSVSTTGFDARQTKFPFAPWNQQLSLESQQMKLEEMRSVPPANPSEPAHWQQSAPMTMMPPQQHQGVSPYFTNVMEPKPQMLGPDQHYPSTQTSGSPPFYAQPFTTMQQQPPMFAAPYQSSQNNDPYLSVSGYGM